MCSVEGLMGNMHEKERKQLYVRFSLEKDSIDPLLLTVSQPGTKARSSNVRMNKIYPPHTPHMMPLSSRRTAK